jgi:hypothetical protein
MARISVGPEWWWADGLLAGVGEPLGVVHVDPRWTVRPKWLASLLFRHGEPISCDGIEHRG